MYTGNGNTNMYSPVFNIQPYGPLTFIARKINFRMQHKGWVQNLES